MSDFVAWLMIVVAGCALFLSALFHSEIARWVRTRKMFGPKPGHFVRVQARNPFEYAPVYAVIEERRGMHVLLRQFVDPMAPEESKVEWEHFVEFKASGSGRGYQLIRRNGETFVAADIGLLKFIGNTEKP